MIRLLLVLGILYGPPLGAAVWWAHETGTWAPFVGSLGTLVWLGLWGVALREEKA